MLISFIIPHKGREELLIQTIKSILAVDREGCQIEIIIVTQNTTIEYSFAEQKEIPCKIVFRPEHETIARLRNIGVSHSSGEYLAFIDADINLSQNWLTVMMNELCVDQERVMVAAIQQCSPDAGDVERIKVVFQLTRADQEVEYITGRNLFLSRTVFEQAGGFPENIVTCEDYCFTQLVRRFGKLYVTSKTSYIHLGEDKNYMEVFQKEIWRGQSNLPSIRNRRVTFWELPSILFPLLWIPFSLFIVLFFSIIREFGFASIGCIILIFPVLLYAVRLRLLSKQQVSFKEAIKFYSVYLFARTIGMFIGIVKGK